MPDGLAETADDGLGQLLDVAVGVEGVLDLLVGDGGGVDADEALVGPDHAHHVLEDGGVEDDVAVHPEDAAVAGVATARASRLFDVLVLA